MGKNEKVKILYIEDDELDQMTFLSFIDGNNLNYDCKFAKSVKEATEILKNKIFKIALIDFKLCDGTAFDIIEMLGDIPFIILTGAGDENIAAEAMKKGAYDYIVKDMVGNYLKSLPMIIVNTIKRKEAEKELKRYQENLEVLVEERTEELKKEIEEHEKEAEKTLEETETLKSKVRTLNCYHLILNLILDNYPSVDNLFEYLVKIIPSTFHVEEITSARIIYNDLEFRTHNFIQTDHKLSAKIYIDKEMIGIIEICIIDEHNEFDKDIFYGEEILFVQTLAAKIGKIVNCLNDKNKVLH
jgi:ActR/RegA family two-component response regulator